MGEQVELVIPLAPTVTLEQLASYADAEANPYSSMYIRGRTHVLRIKSEFTSSVHRHA